MIAVTGANGYIGQLLVAQLVRAGLSPIAIGRSKPTTPCFANVNWLDAPSGSPSADQLRDCDALVHLAGRAHTKVAFADGQDLFDIANHQMAVRTAIAAASAGVKRFVFISTLGVHGSWSPTPVHEGSPICASTPYTRSKWAAEQALAKVCSGSEMFLCVVRPPMVYGPSCPGNFPRLVRLVKRGLPLPFASVDAQRSFMFVENLVDFLRCCATQSSASDTFVIGDGSDWSLPQLVHSISSMLHGTSRMFSFPPSLLRAAARMTGFRREADSLTLPMSVDWSHAVQTFSWRPPFGAAEALSETIASFRERR